MVLYEFPIVVLELKSFFWTVFAFTNALFCRWVINLGDIVLEWIRLTSDLRFVSCKTLIAFVKPKGEENFSKSFPSPENVTCNSHFAAERSEGVLADSVFNQTVFDVVDDQLGVVHSTLFQFIGVPIGLFD